MISQLDTQSWAKEILTGNAEFIAVPAVVSPPTSETIWVVSNVRAAAPSASPPLPHPSFIVLRSNSVPPDPGPGSSFTTIATIDLPDTIIDFDPAIAYDTTGGGNPLIHIIGTTNELSNPNRVDLLLYTVDTVALTVSGPTTLISGSSIQTAYDIVALNDSAITSPPGGGANHKLVAAAINNPLVPPLFQGTITNVAIASSTLTVTANNSFSVGQLVALAGLTSAAFLNGLNVQVTSATGTQFTALYYYQSVAEAHFIPATPAYTIAVNNVSTWESDVRVVFASNGVPLTPVISSPGPGQYVPGSTYTFNAADASKGVKITYNRFYASAADTGTATPVFTGQSLIAFELDAANIPVANSLKVLANSPERTGNVVSSVSLVTPDALNVEVYYESHPKTITFADQLFSFYVINRVAHLSPPASYIWDASPTLLTTFQGRYTDDRLTVLLDSFGNRYMSQTYFTQSNHPEGIIGNALLGTQPSGGSWIFHPTSGSIVGGSIAQGTLSISQISVSPPTPEVNYAFLLEPFEAVPRPANSAASYSFHVASVNTTNMAFTDVPGFFNQQNFTWLRGTKSVMDNASLWAVVGEKEVLSNSSETQLIPATAPYSLEVTNASTFWQDTSVVDNSGTAPVAYAAVIDNPAQGQYVVQPNGEYIFNAADASVGIIGLDLTSNVLTVTGSNIANLRNGMQVLFQGLTHSTFLNGQLVTVTGINLVRSTFNASFIHSNDSEHSETGLAGKPLTISYNFVSAITPVYVSFFNVPPVAALSPTNATVYRAQPLTLSAANSVDADDDAMQFIWTENDSDIANIALTTSDSLAVLNVSRAIGGNQQAHITNVTLATNVVTFMANNTFAPGQIVLVENLTNATFLNGQNLTVVSANPTQFTANFTHADYPTISPPAPSADNGDAGVYRNFNVGVAVVDLFPDLTTPRHPAIPVTNIQVDSFGTVTVTANTNLAPGETVMLYSIANISPPILISEVNDLVYTVQTWSPTSFTATTASSLSVLASTPVTGFVIPQFQFAISAISVPFNAAPTITFPSPQWSAFSPPTVPYASAARNTLITLAINPTDAPPHPVIVTGINDIDDNVSFLWEQTSGTTVLPGLVGQGHLFPYEITKNMTFRTNGADVHGETLAFQLTINDGVNPTVTAAFEMVIAAYNFTNLDTKQLSRSVWQEQDTITNVAIGSASPPVHNILTITANNTFAVGQRVTFSDVSTATFLNGQTVTVASVIGSAPYTGFTAPFTHADYAPAADTGLVTTNARISQRNSAQTWSALDKSVIYSNLGTVKRASVLDGTDRYIVISSDSVLIYGGISPNMVLIRKLLTPLNTLIVDAVHTEDDYTLVLDATGTLYRYSTAPLINTDNPDTTINLAILTSMRFSKIFATSSHSNVRVLAFSGPDGCFLMQVANDILTIQSTLTLTTSSNLVVGSSNVQFVRLSNVETISSGKILLGTATNVQASVTAISVAAHALTVTCNNNFKLGDVVTFSGFTGPTAFLNGITVPIITVTSASFETSLAASNLGTTATATTALATANNDGKTFETLIDLPHNQIIGTWDASKLRNQYVNTGEILFEPNSSYAGRPAAPAQGIPIVTQTPGGPAVTIVWSEVRPDLVTGYNIEYAVENGINIVVGGSLTFVVPTSFGSDIQVTETVNVTQITISSGTLIATCGNSYTPGTRVTFSGMNSASFLNGQTVVVATASGTQFTASFVHADYGPTVDVGFATQTLTSLIINTTANQIAIASNVLTVTCDNNFVPGASVTFTNMTSAVFLDNQTVTVSTASPTQFTASFPSVSYGPASDTGTVSQSSPGPNQYTVSTGGFYTFNSAQLSRSVTISYLSPYAVIKQVGSGATQKVTFPLASGSYFFRIQARSPDGPSEYSNVQTITF